MYTICICILYVYVYLYVIISYNIPASQEGFCLFYNPPLESATSEICVNSAKPSKTLTTYIWFVCVHFFFCISCHSSGNRAFYSFATLVLEKRFS